MALWFWISAQNVGNPILAIGMLVAHERRHAQTGHGREAHLQKLTNGAEGFEDVPSLRRWRLRHFQAAAAAQLSPSDPASPHKARNAIGQECHHRQGDQ